MIVKSQLNRIELVTGPEMFQPYMMAAAQQMQQLQKTLHQNAAVAAARIAQVKRKCSTKSLFPYILSFLYNSNGQNGQCCIILLLQFSGTTFQPRRGSPACHPTGWHHTLPRSPIRSPWIPQLRFTRLPCRCKAASSRYDN